MISMPEVTAGNAASHESRRKSTPAKDKAFMIRQMKNVTMNV